MTDPAALAASAAWLAKEHPDWNQQATSASQAAQINAAYLANQLPVLPQYAAGGGAKYTAAEIADAQAEAAKYAYFNAPIDYAKYANVPLSQMPENVASRVQNYYREHPSTAAQTISSQYETSRDQVVGSAGVMYTGAATAKNPYNPNSALGIAWEVAKTGGATDTLLGYKTIGEAKAIEKATGQPVDTSFITFATDRYITRPTYQQEILTTKEGQHFVNQAWAGAPIRENVTLGDLAAGKFTGALESGIHTAAGDWGGLYTPQATKAEISNIPTSIKGEKTGAEFADYGLTVVNNKDQLKNALTTYVPYGSYTQEELKNTKLTIDKATGEVAIYQYDAARQQWGLIGGGGRNALQSGMFSIGKALTPYVTSQEGAGTYVRPSGEGLTRLGAESTGGFVKPVSAMNLLSPNEAVSRYYGEGKYNLANFVDQVAAGKAEAPGAHIHYTLAEGATAPSIQYMDQTGVVKGQTVVDVTGRTINQIVGGAAEAKAPFVSARYTPTAATVGAPLPVSPTSVSAQVGESPISVAIGALSKGQLPSASALWESTPIAKIAKAWTWDADYSIGGITKTTQEIAAREQAFTPMEQFERTAAIVPFGSEIKTTSFARDALVGIVAKAEEHAVAVNPLTGEIVSSAAGKIGFTTPEAFESVIKSASESGIKDIFLLHTHPISKGTAGVVLEHPSDVDVAGQLLWKTYAKETYGVNIQAAGVVSEKGVSLYNVAAESPYAEQIASGLGTASRSSGLYTSLIEKHMNLPEELLGTSGKEYYAHEAAARGKAISELGTFEGISTKFIPFTEVTTPKNELGAISGAGMGVVAAAGVGITGMAAYYGGVPIPSKTVGGEATIGMAETGAPLTSTIPGVSFTGEVSKIGSSTGLQTIPGSLQVSEVKTPASQSIVDIALNTAGGIINTFSFGLVPAFETTRGFEKTETTTSREYAVSSPFISKNLEGYRGAPVTVTESTTAITKEQSVYDAINAAMAGVTPKLSQETTFAARTSPEASKIGSADWFKSAAVGGYQSVAERPLDVVKNVALAGTFIAGGELIGGGAAMLTAGTRVASVLPAVGTAVSVAMTGLYGYSVAERTGYGTKPYELGGIATTEAIPLFGGGYTISKAPTTLAPAYESTAARLSGVADVMAGEKGVSISTRPTPISETVSGYVSRIPDPLHYFDVARTGFLEGVPNLYEQAARSVYSPVSKLTDVYSIQTSTKETPLSPSGISAETTISKTSQFYQRPSVNIPGLGEYTIPLTRARPVGEPVTSIISVETLPSEYARARVQGSTGLAGELVSQEYITRTAFPTYEGYIRGEEVVSGAQQVRPAVGSEAYMKMFDIAVSSTKTPEAANVAFAKMLESPVVTSYGTKSVAFGRPGEGVTLANVWGEGRVISEAITPSGTAQMYPVSDISGYILGAEKTSFATVGGRAVGVSTTSISRTFSESALGVPTYESGMGTYFEREVSPGKNVLYEGETAKAGDYINSIIGSSFPAKGKPRIGETHGIIQNVLDRIAVHGDVAANIGRITELQSGAANIAEISTPNPYEISLGSFKGGGRNVVTVGMVPQGKVEPYKIPEWAKPTKTGVISIQRERPVEREFGYTGLQIADISRAGQIEYPRGPSPATKTKYVEVEGEPEYIRATGSRKAATAAGLAMLTQMPAAATQYRVEPVTARVQAAEVRQKADQVFSPSSMLGTIPVVASVFDTAIPRKYGLSEITGVKSGFDNIFVPTTSIIPAQITTPSQGQKQTPKQTPEQVPGTDQTGGGSWWIKGTEWVPPVTPVLPGGVDLRSAAAGGGGGISAGFKFTDILQVKSAREVMFGRTPSKKKGTARKPYKFI